MLRIRKHEHNKWKGREKFIGPRPPLAFCPSDSPLQFPSTGIEIEPKQGVTLVGLAISASQTSYWDDTVVEIVFKSMRGLGVLSLPRQSFYSFVRMNVVVRGNNTNRMTLSAQSRHALNLNVALKDLMYQSTVAVVNELETVSVSFLGNVFDIHIRIRRKRMPYLRKTSSVFPRIEERVTIATKTFERYDKVIRLIDSVLKYYPSLTIIVADDSVNFHTIRKKNVLHYRMPPQIGWFAGRNLVVSQVMTEYLVWVDDDFVFDKNTKLELFMEKLDRLDLRLDLVAGHVVSPGKTGSCGSCLQVEMDREGYCVTVNRSCSLGPLDGYPQCVLVDRALNFFMARTKSVHEIGFDPHFNHIGHTSFFIDGYHTLRSACCSDVSIGHFSAGSSPFYHQNRRISGQELIKHQSYILFKYNMKCISFV